MGKGKNKKVDKVSMAFGIISIILLFMVLISPFLGYGSPISFIILIIAFGYTIYKTLYKKETLSKSEKIAFIILLIIILVLPMVLSLWASSYVSEHISG